MTEANITIEDTTIANSNKIVKTIHVTGQLDESNVDEKIKIIYKIFETNPKGVNLIFDLEGLDYMNSKSIGYMTDLYGKVTEAGGTIAIAKPKPNITDILQVVGLTQLIKTFDSSEEAKKYIAENGATTTTAAVPASTAPASSTATATPTPPTAV
ncbi:STAS domain-containing protein [Candidatus Peregrinibacteria bacterium]|nr:STAS domain-containing protein [Candidatus Peregrinibacteria bacterium]